MLYVNSMFWIVNAWLKLRAQFEKMRFSGGEGRKEGKIVFFFVFLKIEWRMDG